MTWKVWSAEITAISALCNHSQSNHSGVCIRCSQHALCSHWKKTTLSSPHNKDNSCCPAVEFHNMKQKLQTSIEAPVAFSDDVGNKPAGWIKRENSQTASVNCWSHACLLHTVSLTHTDLKHFVITCSKGQKCSVPDTVWSNFITLCKSVKLQRGLRSSRDLLLEDFSTVKPSK